MKSPISPGRSVAFLSALYRLLMVAYPASFRQEYGAQMVQVFRTSCYQIDHKHGPGALLRFSRQALFDLLLSAHAERMADAQRHIRVPSQYLYPAALMLALITGYLHVRFDTDATVVLLLLTGTFWCGLMYPAGAWRWAFIAGSGIPAALLLAHGTMAATFAHGDMDLPLPAAFLPTLLGSYFGVVVHHLLRRPVTKLSFK